MATNKEIHEFAVRWFEMYRSLDTAEHEVEEGFADECFALGFEMDLKQPSQIPMLSKIMRLLIKSLSK
jgi:hypothetical protein